MSETYAADDASFLRLRRRHLRPSHSRALNANPAQQSSHAPQRQPSFAPRAVEFQSYSRAAFFFHSSRGRRESSLAPAGAARCAHRPSASLRRGLHIYSCGAGYMSEARVGVDRRPGRLCQTETAHRQGPRPPGSVRQRTDDCATRRIACVRNPSPAWKHTMTIVTWLWASGLTGWTASYYLGEMHPRAIAFNVAVAAVGAVPRRLDRGAAARRGRRIQRGRGRRVGLRRGSIFVLHSHRATDGNTLSTSHWEART